MQDQARVFHEAMPEVGDVVQLQFPTNHHVYETRVVFREMLGDDGSCYIYIKDEVGELPHDGFRSYIFGRKGRCVALCYWPQSHVWWYMSHWSYSRLAEVHLFKRRGGSYIPLR